MMKSATRRSFLGYAAMAPAIPALPSLLRDAADQTWIEHYKDEKVSFSGADEAHRALVEDETFWYRIKTMYTSSPGLLNLNNGGVSPQPLIVQEAHDRYDKLSNEAPSYYMWRILDQGREPLRQRLADFAGTSPEELAICRNSSEALETAIFGLRLQKGDKVVVSNFDYPNMMNAWKQREHRDGIVLHTVKLDLPRMTNDEIVRAFDQQISEGVKVVHITHVINWNGHILPVRQIADIAHQRGAEVIVDGAHSFAHLVFTIPSTGADYFGTSLHKWLCAPFGSGLLYVKKSKIENLYPLLASSDPVSDDIRKFESLGTRSFAIEQAIGQALDFQLSIGNELKRDRLQYLKSYWTEAVMDVPRIQIWTDTSAHRSCALCVVGIRDITPLALTDALQNQYKIHTTPIDHEGVLGVRITPHVYTVKSDLDRLISALKTLANT